MMLSVFADSFETLGELTVEVITMLWASPQDAWLEREDRKPCWPTGHMYVHSQGQESHVFHCASHSKGHKQVCVCDHRFPMILTHSIHTEKFCRVLPDTPLDTPLSKLLGSKCIGVYASGIYFLMSQSEMEKPDRRRKGRSEGKDRLWVK